MHAVDRVRVPEALQDLLEARHSPRSFPAALPSTPTCAIPKRSVDGARAFALADLPGIATTIRATLAMPSLLRSGDPDESPARGTQSCCPCRHSGRRIASPPACSGPTAEPYSTTTSTMNAVNHMPRITPG